MKLYTLLLLGTSYSKNNICYTVNSYNPKRLVEIDFDNKYITNKNVVTNNTIVGFLLNKTFGGETRTGNLADNRFYSEFAYAEGQNVSIGALLTNFGYSFRNITPGETSDIYALFGKYNNNYTVFGRTNKDYDELYGSGGILNVGEQL